MVMVAVSGFPALAIASEVTLLMDTMNVSAPSTKSSLRIMTDTLAVLLSTAPTVKVTKKGVT